MTHQIRLEKGINNRNFDLFRIEYINTVDVFSIDFYTKPHTRIEILVDKKSRQLTAVCHEDFSTESTMSAASISVHFLLPEHVNMEEYFTQKYSSHYYIFFKMALIPAAYHYYF